MQSKWTYVCEMCFLTCYNPKIVAAYVFKIKCLANITETQCKDMFAKNNAQPLIPSSCDTLSPNGITALILLLMQYSFAK